MECLPTFLFVVSSGQVSPRWCAVVSGVLHWAGLAVSRPHCGAGEERSQGPSLRTSLHSHASLPSSLSRPTTHTTSSHSKKYYAPSLWNNLPPNLNRHPVTVSCSDIQRTPLWQQTTSDKDVLSSVLPRSEGQNVGFYLPGISSLPVKWNSALNSREIILKNNEAFFKIHVLCHS
jgi:hypothetical protein